MQYLDNQFRRKNMLKNLMTATFLTPLVMLSQVSNAQEYGQDIDEVIVTGSKRSVKLSEMDGFVEIVDAKKIESLNINAIEQLGASITGLSFNQRSSAAYNNISLRGQSSPDFYDTKVQVYVDGLAQDQSTFGQLLPVDLKQVEVLYGPQGTLYGRGAIGGVLNIVTRKPSEDTVVASRASYGTLRRNIAAIASGGIVKDTVYADIAAGYQKNLGEYTSLANGERLGDTVNKHARLRLRYAPLNSPVDVVLTAKTMDVSSTEEQYVPENLLEERSAFPVVNEYDLVSNHYSGTASYTLENMVLTSLTSYQDRTFDRTVFSTHTPEEQSGFSQEIRLASKDDTGNSAISYVLGGYYETIDFEHQRPAYALVSTQKSDNYAIFGDFTWKLTDKLSISPGLRASWYEIEARGVFGTFGKSASKSYNSVSPKISIGYQIDEATRIYGLYSSGFKAGGYTRLVTPAIVDFNYEPEKVDNFEIGYRRVFTEHKGEFSIAAYATKNKDYQFNVGLPPFQYLQNIGDSSAKGIDASLKLQPIEGLHTSLSVSYNDSHYTRYENPFQPNLDLTDNQLAYAPSVIAHFNLGYEIDLGNDWGTLTPSFNLNYKSKTFFDEFNQISQDGFVLLNSNLSWELSNNVSLDAYFTNMTDETYTVYGFDGGPGLGKLFQVGRGRELGIRVNLNL